MAGILADIRQARTSLEVQDGQTILDAGLPAVFPIPSLPLRPLRKSQPPTVAAGLISASVSNLAGLCEQPPADSAEARDVGC